jgi:hypothetical protein
LPPPAEPLEEKALPSDAPAGYSLIGPLTKPRFAVTVAAKATRRRNTRRATWPSSRTSRSRIS